MKKLFIYILLFSMLHLQVFALSSKRDELLLEAKSLYKQYEIRKNRYEAWKSRYDFLVKKFEKEHKGELNSDNRVIKKRAIRYKKEFYRDLKKRDKELKNSILDVRKKIEKLQQKFYQQYSVPLTTSEIFRGDKPVVKDKYKKVRLLKSFISFITLLDKESKKIVKFDKKRELILSKENLSKHQKEILIKRLDHTKEKRAKIINEYKQKLDQIKQIYKNRFGVELKKKSVAKEMLNNILASK